MTPILPFVRPRPVEVFAVEDTSAQLTWRRLPRGEVSVRTETGEHHLGIDAAAGAGEVTALRPSATTPVDLLIDGLLVAQPMIHTLEPLQAEPLSRIATISDLHLGERGFGLVKPMRDHGVEPYPIRCARAAAREAVAWGAELLVIKGDITNRGRPDEWEMLDELLGEIPIPVVAVPGNHDNTADARSLDATEELGRRGLLSSPVRSVDVPGARVVLVDSTVHGHSWGRIRRRFDELGAAVDTDAPVLVFMHHHLEDQIFPWFWPLGIQRHDATPALDDLVATNPDLLISSGHTHRNRIRLHGSALITEVSSTKDFPGVWAGYTVHADGVRQTVRRIADPDCIGWTDRTHAAVAGIWGVWSPGGLHHRSYSHRWTRTTPSGVLGREWRSLTL